MKVCLRCNSHYLDKLLACPEDGARLIPTGDDPLIGTIVGGRYKVICAVGSGSMGIVYKAVQENSGREMALKVLRNLHQTSEDTVKRFRREAKTASSLKHPNIVTLFDFGFMDDGQPYIITEFLKGLTLAQFLREHGYMAPLKARAVIKQVCDAVGEAHRHKIVHRDLKPENIVLQGKDQGGRFVKVVDFGIAKMLGDTGATSADLTLEGKVCGSPAYMSPEGCRGAEIDYRCDIYSLGIVIFETLTGRRPFVADDLMALMFLHVNEPAPKLSSVRVDPVFTPELEAVIAKALSKEPKDRQQSAEELWEEFNAAAQGERPQKRAQTADWIPFSSSWSEPPYLKLPGLDDASDSMEYLGDFGIESGEREHKTEQRKKLRKLSKGKLWFKVAALAAILGASFVYMKMSRYKDAVAVAQVLTTQGRPEDAVRILERLKQQGDLAVDNAESLNSAYVQAAVKFGNKRQYPQAIELLQKVQPTSKFRPEAADLMRKFKKH
jgi:serine/threonine protein kinase